MTWTYSDPTANAKDAVRFLVGDTDINDQLLQDEEIGYLLSTEGGTLQAAVTAAQAIAARFSRQADKAVGDLRISLSQKARAYLDLADRLKQRSGIMAVPYAGGLAVNEKIAASEDVNVVQPTFKRGMMGWSETSLSGFVKP